MRKVQEFISRFSNNTHPSVVALAEKLNVPQQQAHEGSEFPSDPDAVKSWFLTHNAFGAADPVQTLLRALQQCNRTENTIDNRIAILQHFEKPCVHALQSLDIRYLYLDFPLQEDAEIAFELANKLCEEMAYGYKLALSDSIKNQNNRDKKACAQVIDRALEHLGRIALRHSMIYRPWPVTIWADSNALIQIAQYEGNANIKYSSQRSDVVGQYAHLCAFHILATGNLQASELRGLYTDLISHTATIDFQRKPTGTSSDDYCIANHNPPTLVQFTRYNKKDKPLYFSTQALIRALKDTQHTDNNAPAYHAHLSDQPGRESARATRDNTISAVTGLEEIHNVMSIMPLASDFESQYTDPAELTAQNAPSHASEITLLLQTEDTNFGTSFVAENQSSSGIGLRVNEIGSSDVQIGGLIAHCYGNSKEALNWHVGVIKWLKTEQDRTLKLGVETISKHGKPVEVRRLIKGKTPSQTSTNALLANYQPIDNKVPQLILPAHAFKSGETVRITGDDGFRQVKLIECITQNSQFQSFAIVQNRKLKLVTSDGSRTASGKQVAA